MIEVNQVEQSSETLTRLMRQLADASRAARANAQRVVDLEQELERTAPVAAAAHAYCAGLTDASYTSNCAALVDALLATHRATTPSQTPATHVIVAVNELELLKAIKQRAHAVERHEVSTFPRRPGRRDLAADVAAFILDGTP